MPRPSAPLLLALIAALGGVFLLVEHWIVTDREAIEALVEEAREAVVDEDFDHLLRLLTEDFEARGKDREATVRDVQELWQQNRPAKLRTEVLTVEVEGDEAHGRTQADVSILGRPYRLLLDVRYARTPEGWRVQAARIARAGPPRWSR